MSSLVDIVPIFLQAGHYICLSLKGVTRAEIKKGFVLVADRSEAKIAVKEFWAWINILHSPTTIKVGYQPMVHVDQVRQSVRIMEIQKLGPGHRELQRKAAAAGAEAEAGGKVGAVPLAEKSANLGSGPDAGDEGECLRTGDKAHIRVRFMVKPEYIKQHMKMIFREGRVKAAGRVIER